MTPEYDVGQTVWSKELRERVTINVISIDADGITYIDPVGICHKSTELSAEEPLITQEQFDKVWAEWDLTSHPTFKGSVFAMVKECIKEVQE